MAIMEDESPEVKIKQEEVNGNAIGPIPRRKEPSSSSTGSHVTSTLARYFFFYSHITVLTDTRLIVWYVIIPLFIRR